jgi:4-aminobutyrate aminotransferase-like enzyme
MIKDRSMLMSKGGIFRNVFRIVRPLCITKADACYIEYSVEEYINKLK